MICISDLILEQSQLEDLREDSRTWAAAKAQDYLRARPLTYGESRIYESRLSSLAQRDAQVMNPQPPAPFAEVSSIQRRRNDPAPIRGHHRSDSHQSSVVYPIEDVPSVTQLTEARRSHPNTHVSDADRGHFAILDEAIVRPGNRSADNLSNDGSSHGSGSSLPAVVYPTSAPTLIPAGSTSSQTGPVIGSTPRRRDPYYNLPPRDEFSQPDPTFPGGTFNSTSFNGGGPHYRWFIYSQYIDREVLQADIQRYLGPRAVSWPTQTPSVRSSNYRENLVDLETS